MDLELTNQERAAIRSLERLAKKWPKSLWLFSSGTLMVMKLKVGKRATIQSVDLDGSAPYDQEYCVADIDIPSDGGDF